jgi:hypothetical protein
VGLCSHHDVEFSAISAAPRRSSAGLGGEFSTCHLDRRSGSTGSGSAPAAKQLGDRRVRAV